MDDATRTEASKFLSWVLRHRPEAIGIQLDSQGWTDIQLLLEQCRSHKHNLSMSELREVVATSPKQRFSISEDGLRIRANQGHSTQVDLGYEKTDPPEILFHGTIADHLDSIRSIGLDKMQRHHVHLSSEPITAQVVGARRGTPVVLRVLAGQMHRDGYAFFLSTNGVWLTDRVPPAYLEFPKADVQGDEARLRPL